MLNKLLTAQVHLPAGVDGSRAGDYIKIIALTF